MDYALIFLVTETLLTITKENLVLSLGASSRFLNPFVPNAPVLYPLKKLENRMFSGVGEMVHALETNGLKDISKLYHLLKGS